MTVRSHFLWRLSSGRVVCLYGGLSSSHDHTLTSYSELASGYDCTLAFFFGGYLTAVRYALPLHSYQIPKELLSS